MSDTSRTTRGSRVATAVAVALGLVGLGEAASAEPGAGEAEARVFDLLNGHRASHGLGPLGADIGLQDVARRHAARMAGAGALAHNPRLEIEAGPAVPSWLRLGENVASGSDADAVVAGILGSSAHHANIDGNYDLVGVGGAVGPDGTLFVTQVFALSSTQPGPSVAAALTAPIGSAAVPAVPTAKTVQAKPKAKAKAKARAKPKARVKARLRSRR